MIKNRKIAIIAASTLFATCAAVGAAFGIRSAINVNAQAKWGEVVLSEYSYGQSFTVPERTVVIGEEEYYAKHCVVYPDGRAVSSAEVTLDVAGKYTIRYTATDNGGRTYIAEETFVVSNASYVYNSPDSSAVYTEGYSYGDYATQNDGLMVRLQDQDALSFQSIITVPKETNAAIDLVRFFVTPDEVGAADFKTVNLTFTDVFDSDSVLRVQLNVNADDSDSVDGWWAMYTYVMAAGSGQTLKGLEGTNNIHENDGYGGPVVSNSFYAIGANKIPVDPSENSYTVSYNPVTQEIFVNNRFIVDLDDKTFFGSMADVIWHGFTTGKVRLSVSGDNYKRQSANFFMTYVKDIDLESDVVEDNQGPEITVYTGYDTENMPEAYVGEGEYYPVPEASAFDLFSGVCPVTVGVYLNYNTATPTKISVKDGKFEVKYKGTYAIEYVSEDKIGNKTVKVAWVHAGGEIEEMTFSGTGAETDGVVGRKLTVAKPTVSGGTGEKSVTVVASTNGEEISFGENNKDWSFYPETAGRWTITYTAEDFLGKTATDTVEVDLAIPPAPVFRDEPSYPVAYLDGFEYVLPEIIVYDYRSGRLDMNPASVKVTDKNGEKIYVSGETFVPEVENSGDKIKIKYFYAYDGTETGLPEKEVACVYGIDFKDQYQGTIIDNYFFAEEKTFTTSLTDEDDVGYDEGLLFTVTAAGTSGWTFVNYLAADGFLLDLRTVAGKSDFSAMALTLTDVENEEQSLEIRLVKGVNGYRVISGTLSETTAIPAVGATLVNIGFNKNKIVVGGISYSATKYVNGEDFYGFASGMVKVDFRLENASEGAQYFVYAVSGQLTSSAFDYVSPTIAVIGDRGGTVVKGETYYVGSAVATDVLAPAVEFWVTVTDPDGNIAKDEDGVLLDKADPTVGYFVVCDKYGDYRVTYTAREKGVKYPNDGEYFYTVSVIDTVAPTAEIEKFAAEYKVGQAFRLPKCVATDDETQSDKIVIEIGYRDPNGRFRSVKDGGFVLSVVGKYELRYLILDEAGNSTMYNFVITVTE